jgi:serine/threonine-protein kinase
MSDGDRTAGPAGDSAGAPDPGSAAAPDRPAAAAPPPEPPPPRARRSLAVSLSLVGLAGAAFLTGLLVFNNLVMPRIIHGVGETRVPDLANLTLEQAEKSLQPLPLTLTRAGERFDPSVPRGFILSQDPPPDTPVRGRRMVSVVVSLGEEFSSVPELFGSTVRGASVLLARAGLTLGGMTRAPSEEVGEGLVVATDPPAEAVLPRNTPVSLLFSAGAGPESFVMPDLVGRDVQLARREFEAMGFRVLCPPRASSGAIFSQNPAPGSRITRGASIFVDAAGPVKR